MWKQWDNEIWSVNRNPAEIEAVRLVPDLLFFKKVLYVVKPSGRTSVSIYLDSPWLEHTIKTNDEISDCWSRDMLNFDFLEKNMELVSHAVLC